MLQLLNLEGKVGYMIAGVYDLDSITAMVKSKSPLVPRLLLLRLCIQILALSSTVSVHMLYSVSRSWPLVLRRVRTTWTSRERFNS